jgi:ABC-type multidrug transport system fused ATPase/permease subunit
MEKSLLRYAMVHRIQARLLIVALALIATVSGLLSPFFQKIFIDRLLGASVLTHGMSGFGWLESVPVLSLIGFAFVTTFAAQGFSILASYCGIREGVFLQREFSEILYGKMLSLRSDRMVGTSVGEVVSIYATDIPGSTAIVDQALPAGAGVVFPLLLAPIVIHWICGIELMATIAVMGTVVTLLFAMAFRQSRFFYRFKQLAAERTGIVNEWIQNMRLLRILGWIEKFEDRIFHKREEETLNRVAMVTNGQLMGAFGSSISFVVNLMGISSLVFLREKPVTPSELFALLWIFGVFLARPFRQIPWIVTFTFDSLTSIRRLENFLGRPADESFNLDKTQATPASEAPLQIESVRLIVHGLNLNINGRKLLDNIDFEIKPGEFVAVVGEVGAGKTLLLQSLVGETGATFSQFKIGNENSLEIELNERRRRFAFVPQEGFVMSSSLRENVKFEYDGDSSIDLLANASSDSAKDKAAERSLELAQFRLQGEALAEGLDSEIGERGVNLSGGQRQRVSLARAHFFDRPTILLDDCLSALDVDTESQLIRDLIDGAWKQRTRILVTHRLSVLEKVDRVFFMESGRVIEQGPFEDLLRRSAKVRDFVSSVRRTEDTIEAGIGDQKAQRNINGEAQSVS